MEVNYLRTNRRAQIGNITIPLLKGEQGYSISRIVRTSGDGGAGTVDTYTVYIDTDPETAIGTFQVVNGTGGDMSKSVYDIDNDDIVDRATGDGNGNEITATYETIANVTALANRVATLEQAGYITKSVSDLANYYLKSETYTKQEVNNLCDMIPKFAIEVVSVLPTQDISETTIYLLRDDEETQDVYQEYIYVNNAWERIGGQRIDLSNYYQKSEVDDLLNDKADTSDLDSYYTKNSVDGLLNQKINTNDIIDNLTSTNNTKVLSAKQGKALKDLLDINNNNIANESTERVNADNLLQSQITSLASGSPLVASSISEMTDTTRTYVNTTDGNWYYYNGSSWVSGGVYQSAVVDTTLTQSGIGADANATGQELLKINKNLKFNNNWVKGTMIQGEVYQASAYSPNSRASLNQIIIADENLIVKLSNYNLYKFGIHYFDNNNTFTSETGWQTTNYIIEKGKRFKIVIGLVTIDETSNHFAELVNSISIIPVSKYCEDDIKESLKAKYFNPTLEIGGIYQGNNSTVSNNERLRTPDKIWLNEGDTVGMLNPSVWFACIGYDELKKYNSYDSGWQTKQKFTIPKTGYYRFSFKVQDNSSFGTSNDIYKYERFFIIYNSKGLKQKTFKKATENMHVVLHRGFSPLYPENTLIAFREGKNRGFEEIETDIWFSSDNVPVLCHDPSINRTSNGTGNIADLTLAQLKSYDFGSWKGTEFTGIKIPTLEEAIVDAKIHGYRLQLEPKESWTQEQAEIIVGIIQKYNMSKHVSFGGYDSYDLIKIHSLDDSIDLKRTCTEINQSTIDATLSNSIKSDNNNTTLIIDYSNVTNEGLELAKTSKCPVHVYFANSIDRYEELCGKYIKEVTTDFINPIEFYNGTIIL